MTDHSRDVVLVTEYFHPDSASTGQLMTDLATGLVDRGLDLTVYTSQPNYHSGEHVKQPHEEEYKGVSVRRISAPQLRQTSLLRRLFNWAVFTVWMVVVLARDPTEDRELVFVSNPPVLPPALWLLCRLKGWEYTHIVYDLYPNVIAASGHISDGGFVFRVWKRVKRAVFRDADKIVALGPVMREKIVDVAGEGFDADKVEIIHNWADGDFIQPMEKSENPFSRAHDLVDPFTLVYSGNIGANHDLETIVDAARSFEDSDVRVLIIGEGDGKAKIVDRAESYGLTNGTVTFLPYQDLEDLPYTLTSGDVSLVAVDDGMKGLCVSSKLYTSLAAGKPILLISDPDSDEARIVDRYDAGKQVMQGDTGGVARAIEEWQSDPELASRQGENARAAFEDRFTKEHSIDQYYQLLGGTQTPELEVNA